MAVSPKDPRWKTAWNHLPDPPWIGGPEDEDEIFWTGDALDGAMDDMKSAMDKVIVHETKYLVELALEEAGDSVKPTSAHGSYTWRKRPQGRHSEFHPDREVNIGVLEVHIKAVFPTPPEAADLKSFQQTFGEALGKQLGENLEGSSIKVLDPRAWVSARPMHDQLEVNVKMECAMSTMAPEANDLIQEPDYDDSPRDYDYDR